MVPGWLLDALNVGIHDVALPPPPPVVPGPRQDATPPHIRTPEPKRKRPASPERTPPRKIPRTRAPGPPPAPRRCPTAYAFGEDDDPDAKWSTLPTRRKTAKRAEKHGVRQSGGFRLPLLGLARAIPTVTRTTEAKPRVITYLPPPRVNKKRVDDDVGGARASGSVNRPTRADEVIMTTRIDPLKRGLAQVDTRAQDQAEDEEDEREEIRIMDSDVTLVNEDADDVAQLDLDDVCARYPTTRACMKAVRRRIRGRTGLTFVFDALVGESREEGVWVCRRGASVSVLVTSGVELVHVVLCVRCFLCENFAIRDICVLFVVVLRRCDATTRHLMAPSSIW